MESQEERARRARTFTRRYEMKLDGTKVVLTGTFDTDVNEIRAALEQKGAEIVDTVGFDTGVVFSGDTPGAAFDQAMELGVPVRDERELAAIIAGTAAPATRRTIDIYDDMMIPPDIDDAPFMDFGEMPRELFMDEVPSAPESSRPAKQEKKKKETKKPAAGAHNASDDFEKGSRVKIVGGTQGVGVVGTIFWWGDSKYGDGMRAGVSGDDDETYWVDSEHLGQPDAEVDDEVLETAEKAKAFKRGDRVKVVEGRDAGSEGTIFWWGESKWGDGMRAGIETDDGEKVWADASELAAAEGGSSSSSSSSSSSRRSGRSSRSSVTDYDDDDIPF